MKLRRPKLTRTRAVLGVALLVFAVWFSLQRPSNTRDWTPDNARAATAEFRGDSVFVHDLRDARYRSTTDFDVRWEERAYDLRELERAWFLVEPFGGDWRGPAHTLVSFQFAGGKFLAISAEIRKEKGESFSPWKGLLRQYEMTYVVADENDVVKLRTNYRRDPVYLYPIRTDRAKLRAVLRDMLGRANQLAAHPEFYNTLTNTCTSSLVAHVNRISPHRVPRLSWKVLFPGYSDELAYQLGLIDTDLPFEQARERYHVNAAALRWADAPDFSLRIRGLR